MAAIGSKLSGAVAGAALGVVVAAGLAWLLSLGLPADKFGKWERITVHGASLEGSLEGDSADRTVYVYLPASYRTDPERRYPVVYNLHGFTATARYWADHLKWPGALDRAFAGGKAREMIMVLPDAMTLHGGSMYSNSPVTGDWEKFIAEDLVAHIDARYRTLARAESRGLAGHSMGGYGTVRIGMKRPDVFSAIYAMNACCLAPRTVDYPGVKGVEGISSVAAALKADFYTRAGFAAAAAWSPNPDNPPFFIDVPTQGGVARPEVMARWADNAPLKVIDEHLDGLRRLRAIGIDLASHDPDVTENTQFHDALNARGVAHVFATYDGDHQNRIRRRYVSEVLPFFSSRLAF